MGKHDGRQRVQVRRRENGKEGVERRVHRGCVRSASDRDVSFLDGPIQQFFLVPLQRVPPLAVHVACRQDTPSSVEKVYLFLLSGPDTQVARHQR